MEPAPRFGAWALCRLLPILGVGLLLALAGCGTISLLPVKTTLAADRVELPTTKIGECLFIDARINGAGPFRLIVDTGADSLHLASDVMTAAGLQPLGGLSREVQSGVGRVTASAAQVALFESGGLKLEGIVARIESQSQFANLRQAYGRIDGALGMSALKDIVLEMDFPHGQVSASRPGTQSYVQADSAEYAMNKFGAPEITIDAAGTRVTLLLDTGSDQTFRVPNLDLLPLVFPKIKGDGIGGSGVGVARGAREEIGQLAGEARLGPATWRNPPLAKGRSLGAGALADFTIAIDQRAGRIYFLGIHRTTRWAEGEPPDLRLKPGYFGVIESSGVRLTEVDAGGAFARAGLRVGDLLLRMNNEAATSFVAAELPTGKRIDVSGLRAGRPFRATLILPPADSQPPK